MRRFLLVLLFSTTNGAFMVFVLHSLLGDQGGSSVSAPSFPTNSSSRRETAVSSLGPNDNKSIRSWGCGIHYAPLIFVHVGKSGGGSVRIRLAASSLNITNKTQWIRQNGLGIQSTAYYPIQDGTHRGMFCNSRFYQFNPLEQNSYEGTVSCNATTPLGHAACAIQKDTCPCGPDPNRCDVVYTGHNYFGSEMHWLPNGYLQQHWQSQNFSKPILKFLAGNPQDEGMNGTEIKQESSINKKVKCTGSRFRHLVPRRSWYKSVYKECVEPLVHKVDSLARDWFHNKVRHGQQHEKVDNPVVEDWSPLYASLPVARITVIRDPFSWLVSKFFWHLAKTANFTCDNVEEATHGSGIARRHQFKVTDNNMTKNTDLGWASAYALQYILYLCGEDCVGRLHHGMLHDLTDLQHQAEGNLRHGFCVLGMLEETDTFFEMIKTRMGYMNTSLEEALPKRRHSSGKLPENLRCKEKFQNETFQKLLMSKSPEIRIVNNLYHVAKQVNRFQMNELESCGMKIPTRET